MYLDVSKWYTLLISILFDSNKKILIVRVLATTGVVIARSIVSSVPIVGNINGKCMTSSDIHMQLAFSSP